MGCQVEWDADAFVATISHGDNVLEIVPYLIGMRKNRAEGYYVPISGCARFIDGVLYVPARAVAEELGMTVDYADATATVMINN